jgi:S-adenosylmethionine synthetase
VGRGNRVNVVISLNWPAPPEAAAGKSPVSHVGKISTLLSQQMATFIVKKLLASEGAEYG